MSTTRRKKEKWSNNLGLGSLKEKGYAYEYDPMNRITSASFKEKTDSWATPEDDAFSVTNYSYDLNGNILALTRLDERGTNNVMDQLVYHYGSTSTLSNKLLKVTDTGDKSKGFVDGTNTGSDFTYDGNGNMLTDQNKGITTKITYNYLNLPEVVTRGGNAIQYIYDATGRKLAQVTDFGGRRKQVDYAGEFQYENDQLQMIMHEEGRIVLAGTEIIYLNNGESDADYTPTNATLSVETTDTEKYVKAVATSTAARSGIESVGGLFPVEAGERYKIRVKGYRDKGTAAQSSAAYISVQGNGNDLVWPGATLPAGLATASTESWTEQVVIVPENVTVLTIGVTWNTVAVGEVIYINEVEVIKEKTQDSEYQYHLKDHLGNVRLTFTTKDEIHAASATMETTNESDEEGEFLYYGEAVKINNELFDHTYNGTIGATYYATRLIGGNTSSVFGLAKSLRVMPGDLVKTEVWAKYLDTNSANYMPALQNFLASIVNGTAPPGTVVDGGAPGSLDGGTYPFGTIDHSNETGSAPKAYLNWIAYKDDKLTIVDQGFHRITTAAREYGQDGDHVRLFKDITIKEPGYLYIYLSNENATPVEVFFDDFRVEHIKSPVVQVDDYYPFGLTYNSYSRENSVANQYLYNGKEKQDELGLDWFDYGKRMYMPEIGRWYVIDALSESLPSYTPYRYALNNPISYIDVGGYIEWPVKGIQAVNKKDYSNGAWGLENTVVRTSTYLETDRPKGASNPHVGIDYRASENTDFYSLGDGKVVAIGTQEGGKAPGAKYITVEYSNGDRVSFVHINSVADGIKVGDKVYEGQIIGKTGATGTKQAHLHITAKDKDGNQIDPENQNYGSVSSADFFGKYGGDYTKLAGYQADHAPATESAGSNSGSESQGKTKVKETKKAIKVTNINSNIWSDFLDKASRGHNDLMNWLKNGAR